MFKALRILFALILLATHTFASAQPSNCIPLPPPTWIVVSNITNSSADVAWESVSAGAWYQVELYNDDLNQLEDFQVTQNISISYSGLNPGTNYTVSIRASTCEEGPMGTSSEKKFKTNIIITETVAGLEYQPSYDMQTMYRTISGNEQPIPGQEFGICLPQIDTTGYKHNRENHMANTFHAYFTYPQNQDDFFEFTLLAGLNGEVYFPADPLECSVMCESELAVNYLNENGQNVPPNSSEIVSLQVGLCPGCTNGQREFTHVYMTLSILNLVANNGHMPVWVTLGDGVQFHAAHNKCEINGVACSWGPNGSSRMAQRDAADTPPQGFQIAPNPVHDYLSIRLQAADETVQSLRIVESSGKLVYENFEPVPEGAETRIIKTAGWRPGIYFVQIVTDRGVRVQTVLKED